MITCPCCNARLDVELPPDREQANNLVPEPARPDKAVFASTDLICELEAALRIAEHRLKEADERDEWVRRYEYRSLKGSLEWAIKAERGRSQIGEHSNTPTPRRHHAHEHDT